MPATTVPFSRRAALGSIGLAATLGLTGCSFDLDHLDALRPPTRRAPAAPVRADQRIVDSLVARIREAYAGPSEPFHRLHHAQLQALGAKPAATPASGAPIPDSRAVGRREHALVQALRDGALRAESSDLARLLASMAAGQQQLLALHPEVKA